MHLDTFIVSQLVVLLHDPCGHRTLLTCAQQFLVRDADPHVFEYEPLQAVHSLPIFLSARCTWHNLVDLTCATELSLSLSLAPPARARLQSHDLRCLIVPLGTAASFMACHHAQSRSGKDRPCSKTHTQTIWNQLLLWQMHRVSKMPHMICVWFRMWSFLTTPKA